MLGVLEELLGLEPVGEEAIFLEGGDEFDELGLEIDAEMLAQSAHLFKCILKKRTL